MPARNILLLDQEESPWPSFLEEFFNDTRSRITHVQNAAEAGNQLIAKNPEVAFIKADLLTPALIQKLKVQRQSCGHDFFVFCLNEVNKAAPAELSWDADFSEPISFLDFQKKLVARLSYPAELKILIIDDEPEVGAVLTGYLKHRKAPSYQVRYISQGSEGLELIAKAMPDVLVLDIKMPKMTGHEVYRRIVEQDLKLPVIVYFDAVFGDEILELHKIGNPAIIEKGAPESSVENLASLILKMVYFA